MAHHFTSYTMQVSHMRQKFYWVATFLWVFSCFAEYRYDLSVCMIFRDEAPYLKEWIEFHRLVGVEHFYLCSHNSKDNYKEILKPYIKQGIVELKEIRDMNDHVVKFNKVQCGFYSKCLKKMRNVSKWVAFIDSDEFLFPVQEFSLVKLLKSYEQFGGVAANWQFFGTSFIGNLPPGQLLIEHLIHCAPLNFEENKHIKSIVQPIYTSHFINPHFAIYFPGYYQVNTDKQEFKDHKSPYVQVDQLRINHYWTRDEHYFWNFKVPRQNQFWGKLQAERANEMLTLFNQETDFTIQRFVPKLKKKMKGVE